MTAARLAVVLPDLEVGGLQVMAVELAAALDPGAFTPLIYTFDAQGPLTPRLEEAGLAHVHRPRRQGADRGYARGLAERLREDRVDLVHCHNVTALFHGARAATRAGRLPVLFTEHDREMPAPLRHRLLHRWLVRRADAVAVVSDRLRQDLLRYEGFPPSRTRTLVNGIADPQLRAPAGRTAARAALGWDGSPVVLAVGSLTGVKNHRGLIAAHGRLLASAGAASASRPRLCIAGEGPLDAELRAQAAALPAGAVQFLGRRTDVPTLLAAADVFVLPSHREGLSLSLVEAHAMARPSVAFDVGGNGEVLLHEVTGLLVPGPDEAALASALGRLLADPALAARCGAAARQRYLSHFTHARMVTEYVGIYETLLARRAG